MEERATKRHKKTYPVGFVKYALKSRLKTAKAERRVEAITAKPITKGARNNISIPNKPNSDESLVAKSSIVFFVRYYCVLIYFGSALLHLR